MTIYPEFAFWFLLLAFIAGHCSAVLIVLFWLDTQQCFNWKPFNHRRRDK
jgi:hypothetical protein